MQILDAYTKKEYECPVCHDKVYYAKIANDSGELVTTDGQQPNGKFGKDNNVLSAPVDVNVKDRVHRCKVQYIQDQYNKLVKQEPSVKTATVISNSDHIVKWPKVPEQLTTTMSELYHAYQELNTVAYILTKEQHPDEREDSNLFGQIANAKAAILSNLFLARAIKNSKTV